MGSGRLYETQGAATEKALSLTIFFHKWGTANLTQWDDLCGLMVLLGVRSSEMYIQARL